MAAIPGVTSASVNLIKQNISVETALDKHDLLSRVEQLVHAHEPHVQVRLSFWQAAGRWMSRE